MDAQRWRRIGALFDEIVELPEAERSGAIERACAIDPTLRDELTALLRRDAEAERDAPTLLHAPGHVAAEWAEHGDAGHDELAGRTIGRWRVLRELGRGGMGEVLLAASGGIEGAERPVVVKIIRREHETDRSFLARFLDEARIQAQLHHPGVAQILEATSDSDGKPYVVVEHVEGRNLSDVRSRATQLGVRISWPEAVALGIMLGEALAHVHERTDADGRPLEIVPRDLSPQNVMVS